MCAIHSPDPSEQPAPADLQLNYDCIDIRYKSVLLPAAVVEALGLKEGDRIEIRIAGRREFEIARDGSVEKALARIRKLRRPLPPGFKFDRLEANER